MCELFAMSSKIKTNVSISLHEFSLHGGKTNHHADGWGMASFQNQRAFVYREASPAAFSPRMKFIEAHPFPSNTIICHIRHATQGAISVNNTQPFKREYNNSSHVFAHNGNLMTVEQEKLISDEIPQGETDSELAFCYLFSAIKKLWLTSPPTLADRVQVIFDIFTELSTMGIANMIYSDADYLYAFADQRIQPNGQISPPGLHYLQRTCAIDSENMKNIGVHIHTQPQTVCLFASVPLTSEPWVAMQQHQLMVVKHGEIITTCG